MKNKAFTPLQILERKFVTGFTVQELVFVLILVVILARVAIPVYQTVANQSKAASVRATLDEVRAALKAYRMNERLEGRPESWPPEWLVYDWDDDFGVCTPGSCYSGHIFSDCNMPDNPLSQAGTSACARDYTTQCNNCSGRPVGSPQRGWRYDPSDGEFWANSNQYPGENLW